MSAGEATPAHDYVLHDHAHGLDFEPLAWHQHAHDGPGHSGVQHTHAHRHVRPGAVPAPVPSRSIALACGHPEGPATLHRDERTAWCPSCEADVGVTHLSEPPPNPYRSAEAIRAHIDRDWQPVLLDLIELEQAGALAGIRAIVAWRKRIVAGEVPALPSVTEPAMKMARWHGNGGLAAAAALLAAEIDRQEANRGDDNGQPEGT